MWSVRHNLIKPQLNLAQQTAAGISKPVQDSGTVEKCMLMKIKTECNWHNKNKVIWSKWHTSVISRSYIALRKYCCVKVILTFVILATRADKIFKALKLHVIVQRWHSVASLHPRCDSKISDRSWCIMTCAPVVTLPIGGSWKLGRDDITCIEWDKGILLASCIILPFQIIGAFSLHFQPRFLAKFSQSKKGPNFCHKNSWSPVLYPYGYLQTSFAWSYLWYQYQLTVAQVCI